MNTAHLHFTLRQLRRRFSSPAPLAALAAVALVLGVSGPFGTISFGLLARLAYWAAVVPLTYGLGFFGSFMLHPLFAHRPIWLRILGHACGSAVLVAAAMAALNTGLGLYIGGPRAAAIGFAAIYIICAAVEAVDAVIAAQGTGAPQTLPAILSRLPLEKRGELLALAVQDHYVMVTTTRGQTLVLMRLSDAIAQCAPIAGVQVHRSHWVAISAVARARRNGDTATLWLVSGAEIPVARARIARVQAAGLLARKGGAN